MGAEAEYIFFFLGMLMVPVGLVLMGIAAFRRNRRLAFWGSICLTIFVLAVARVNYAQFWKVEACLDHGGSFNYETQLCEYK